MNNLKGFISIPSLANNTQGVTAPFGELSTYASTFSRYKSNYSKPANYAGVELIAFTTKTDTGVYYTPSQTVSDHILQVAYWVYQQHITGSIPSNTYLTQFKNDIALANPGMTNVDINEILVGSSPTLRMPDYVAWEYTSAGTLHHIKIWFSDSRFRSQFDDFEILVVPPLPVINRTREHGVARAAPSELRGSGPQPHARLAVAHHAVDGHHRAVRDDHLGTCAQP